MLDGHYNVYDSEAIFASNFNGLFLLQPEVHENVNCAVITVSEVPANELIEFNDEIILDKAAAEQAYLDGALDAQQLIEVLTENGFLNLP